VLPLDRSSSFSRFAPLGDPLDPSARERERERERASLGAFYFREPAGGMDCGMFFRPGIPQAFRVHSAEGLKGRAAAAGPLGHSAGCKERQKSRVRFCGLRS